MHLDTHGYKHLSEDTHDMPQSQPSRGTKRRRDEKQIMKKQTPHMKPTHKQRRTATEDPPWKGYYSESSLQRQ